PGVKPPRPKAVGPVEEALALPHRARALDHYGLDSGQDEDLIGVAASELDGAQPQRVGEQEPHRLDGLAATTQRRQPQPALARGARGDRRGALGERVDDTPAGKRQPTGADPDLE